jgi:hypothetical protein
MLQHVEIQRKMRLLRVHGVAGPRWERAANCQEWRMATQPPVPGSLEFEQTDLEQARNAHLVAPAGVDEVNRLQPGFWDGRRRAKVATDRAMSGATLDWVIALPAHLRPKQLCDKYPRIANRLAAAWADHDACIALLVGLLDDSRERRRGFPVVLRQEVQRLIEYRQKQPR